MMRVTTIEFRSMQPRKESSDQEEKAKLSAPWLEYYRQVYNLFKQDPDLEISKDLEKVSGTEYKFSIASSNGDKLQAIEKLVGPGRTFDKVKVTIEYKYANNKEEDWSEVLETAFKGNPVFSEVVIATDPIMHTSFLYGVFSREVISFWNDNLGDYNGCVHYIPADLAREVVSTDTNINFCTEKS